MTPRPAVPTSLSTVVLTVHDLDATRLFYERVVGLRDLGAGAGTAQLGDDGGCLLELRLDPAARVRSPRDAGLFHTAFLLPSRADLGRWAVHAARNRFPIQGASDHGVSEAIYLCDPEGNGVELYHDRPAAAWAWSDGMVALTNGRLDADALMRDAGREPWLGVPAGTSIGHVHLQVGAIEPAEAFYAGVLGAPVTARHPGGTFYGFAGYHHHFATNTWNSRGAARRAGRTTGLAEVRMTVDSALIDGVRARAADARLDVDGAGPAWSLSDPWGTILTLAGPPTP